MSFTELLATADSLALDALGQEVTYTSGVGAVATPLGIFDEQYQRVDLGEAGVQSTGPAVFVQLADLSSDPETDTTATVTVSGTTYEITEVQKSKGGIRLLLKET